LNSKGCGGVPAGFRRGYGGTPRCCATPPEPRRNPAATSYNHNVVVLLRLIKTILLSRLKKKIDVFDQARVTMRVWPNDLDLNMHANSGRYISFMDIGRIDLLARMRLLRKVTKLGWRPLVGGSMITYRKSLLPFERFVVKSRILCWDEKWFYFEHIIVNSKGDLATIATVRGLLRGPEGNVPPQKLVDLAGRADISSPPIPAFIVRWHEAEERA
jgi:acyl-CoA thioesterase FadM